MIAGWAAPSENPNCSRGAAAGSPSGGESSSAYCSCTIDTPSARSIESRRLASSDSISSRERALTVTSTWAAPVPRPVSHCFDELAPRSPSISLRAAIPWRNSSENVAIVASGTPSARSPAHVTATLWCERGFPCCHSSSLETRSATSFSQSRPPATSPSATNTYAVHGYVFPYARSTLPWMSERSIWGGTLTDIRTPP